MFKVTGDMVSSHRMAREGLLGQVVCPWCHPNLMIQEMSSAQAAEEGWCADGGASSPESPCQTHGWEPWGGGGPARARVGEQKARTRVSKTLLYFYSEPVVTLPTHELRVTTQLAKQRCHTTSGTHCKHCPGHFLRKPHPG